MAADVTERRCPDCEMLLVGPVEKERGLCPMCEALRYWDGAWDEDDPFEGAGACVILPERNS